MPREKNSITIEDYLGSLFILQRDQEAVTGTRLAEILGVTPPTVTNTLKRMVRDGLVEMDESHCPHLTADGLEAARTVMRRHMLLEWLLIRTLDVSWSQTHSAAHQMEHGISDDVEARMRINLNDPAFCPHGNPLPGFEHLASAWVALDQVPAGKQIIIRRIHEMAEDNPDLMAFLESNGIVPGAAAEVLEVLPFNQTLTLTCAGKSVTLGFPAAHYIYAEMS